MMTRKRIMPFVLAGSIVLALTGCAAQKAETTARSWQESVPFDDAGNRPPTAFTLRTMARILKAQGKTAQAEHVLKRMLSEYPADAAGYSDLAALQMDDMRIDDAIATLSIALGKQPDNPMLLNNLGMCFLRQGEVEMAMSRFRAASQLRPREAQYVANEAVALGWMGMYDQALAAYSSIMPQAEAHYNVGVLCESREDYARAAEEFALAHEHDVRIKVDADLARLGPKLVAAEGTGVETPQPVAAPNTAAHEAGDELTRAQQ